MDKKIIKSMNKSKRILKRLIEEQKKASSTTLKELLDGEINAYFSLGESLEDCVNTLGRAQTMLHHDISDIRSLAQHLTMRAEEIVATKAYNGAHQALTDLKDFIELLQRENNAQIKCSNMSEACCELFANATERNPAKWSRITVEMAVIGAGIALSHVPNVSTIIEIGSITMDTLNVLIKHMQEVPNYKAVDSDILLIEKHTKIMKMVDAFFKRITAKIASLVNTSGQVD